MQFFQINYGLYEPGTKVDTFEASPPAQSLDFREIRSIWDSVSEAIIPKGAHRELKQCTLAAGKSVTVFESLQSGRVVAIRLTPASAFAGPIAASY